MKNISDIDNNFKISVSNDQNNLSYYNIMESTFDISGFAWLDTDNIFCRLPQSQISEFSEALQTLAWCTSGGMVRFKTDSKKIAIKAELGISYDMSHMPRTGTGGFDLYLGSGKEKVYYKTAMPETSNSNTIDEILIESQQKEIRQWTINFPLYGGIKKLSIGVDSDSSIEKSDPFEIEKPIVFYGSSITQGGCASRPGNSYTHHVCRWLDANMLNFGFSGSAKGEENIAELLSKLDMSVFVIDYDHNAPTIEHLKKTHDKFFRIVRNAQPNLPIVLVSKPDVDKNTGEANKRKAVIYKTFTNAIESSDNKVYFVDGVTLFGDCDRDACTVDGCHPNDLGFIRMAKTIYPVIQKALSQI